MFPGIVRARVTVLQEKIDAKIKLAPAKKQASWPAPSDSAGRVVVYVMSLRGIQKMYRDCWSMIAILRSYSARVDGRDLSMHAGFKDELRAALGGGDGRWLPPLP
nr:unnamed protein product [Digitaria exilis]CAB3503632.1 unnamed protein product [Digitaria exilis]CAB3503639.1 unnamed protein product [Digitaria exilis]